MDDSGLTGLKIPGKECYQRKAKTVFPKIVPNYVILNKLIELTSETFFF
jgi:hypothetical protein